MIYLSKENLIALAYEKFIDESSEDNAQVLNNVENQNIELIKSYIGSRYNVTEIFSTILPITNMLLVRILSKMVIYDIIRRNSARKVPTDIKEEYDKALELLEKIATGRIKLDGLPGSVDENGNSINSNSLWGNNTNKNFYI